MPKSQFCEWYRQFTNGREECADAPLSSRPVSTHNATSIVKVKLAFRNDCKQSFRDITDNTGINRENVCANKLLLTTTFYAFPWELVLFDHTKTKGLLPSKLFGFKWISHSFGRISFRFKENFTLLLREFSSFNQFLRKLFLTVKKISSNFYKNFT